MITTEELIDILEKRGIYDRNLMVCYSRGRSSFVLCPNNREPYSDVYVIPSKLQNAKWERVRTIQNMLIRARIHHVLLSRICVFSNSKDVRAVPDGNDDIIIIGKNFQNERAIMQILDIYSI
jgi:hypothetical protein